MPETGSQTPQERVWSLAARVRALAAFCGLLGGFIAFPAPARAQLAGGVCIPSTIPYTSPTWFPACDATGHMLVVASGTVTAVTTFPYSSAAGQAATGASFVGIAGFNGTTVDAIKDVNGGQLEASIYGATGNALLVSAGGAASVLPAGPVPNPTVTTSATLTQPASSASSVTILAANSATSGWTVCNSSTAVLYLAKAATATTAAYTLAFPPAGTVPQCYTEEGPSAYRGILTGIWSAANGNAIVTQW
jgi:hypothetical protein